jgi:hypothetical protein
MYFKNFPTIIYDAVGNGEFKDVKNLLRRVAIRAKVKTNTLLYDTYDVKEGESPESIADKLYDDPELHWIVLLVNDITDRYHQWPLSTSQFLAFINDKYVNADGTSNVDGVHHYEIPQSSGDTKTKIEVYQNSALYTGDSDFYASASIVTNFEYEENEQDKKRKIRLLDPSFIDQFVSEFKSLMKETII